MYQVVRTIVPEGQAVSQNLSLTARFRELRKQIIVDGHLLGKALIRTNAAVLFNQMCIDNNLLPKFTNVRLYNEAVQREPFTGEFRRNLVKHEQAAKKKRQVELQKEFDEERELVFNGLSDDSLKDDLEVIFNAITNAIFSRVTQDEKKQIRKPETKGKALIRTNSPFYGTKYVWHSSMIVQRTLWVSDIIWNAPNLAHQGHGILGSEVNLYDW